MSDWLPHAVRDLRFAARRFAKRPAFTALAALTLALGIGAATAAFGIVRAVLLHPLPYRDPARLAAVWITSTREAGLAKIFATWADYLEFRRHSRTLETVAAATWATRTGRVLTGRGRAREVLTIPATRSFFELLGVPAALGRIFLPSDETRGCSVLLAHGFWTSALASDPAVVGGALTIDDKPCTVVGVMPATFSFYPAPTQAWVLLGPAFQPGQDRLGVGIFARLRPGVTPAQAQAELRGLYRALHPGPESRDFTPVVYDLHGEFTFLAGRTLRTTLLVVFAAVLLLLLIGCLNVANLLLARLSERTRELAVCAALGSGRGGLVRQVLAESLLLAGLGATLGAAFASAGVRYFRHANPIELTVGAEVAVNLPVLAFCAAISVLTTLVCGLLPALRASRLDLSQALKTGARGSLPGRRRFSACVIAIEMALSFLLLVSAGLLIASALRMGSAPLGFDPHRVLAARLSLPASRYADAGARIRFYDRVREELSRLPGAAGSALASRLPPDSGGNHVLEIQGRPLVRGREVHDVGVDSVSPEFFDVLRIPVRRGRSFRPEDREDSLPVAIANEALVREYFPGGAAIGEQVRIAGESMPWLTIVGVARDLKHTQLMNEMSWIATPMLYRPYAQEPRAAMQIAARALAGADVTPVSRAIEQRIAALDPLLPVGEVQPLAARIAKALAYARFRAVVLAFFAMAALLLAAVGLHGVVSQHVARRIPEFGVRKALGARGRDLLLLVALESGIPVVAGLAAGVLVTLACSRLLAGLLYGIQPADAAALAAVSVILLAVAAAAMLLPARHAAAVDPLAALREE